MPMNHPPAQWIWLPQQGHDKDAYALFRRKLRLPIRAPFLRLSASSAVQVSCNGRHCAVATPPSLPRAMRYQEVNLAPWWKAGEENLLEFQVYVLGRESLTTALLPPGLWVELWNGKTLWDATDETWECAPHPAYESGNAIPLSGQLGDTFAYHQDAPAPRWRHARLQEGLEPPGILHAPGMHGEWKLPDSHVVQAGFLFRPVPAPGATPAEQVAADFLQPHVVDDSFLLQEEGSRPQALRFGQPMPFLLSHDASDGVDGGTFTWPPRPPEANGWYLIVDLGEERTGWLTLRLNARKGAILDVAHGEHLRDGRVRAAIGGRNYADRIHCSGKPLAFTHHLRRLGARYLELHVTNTDTPPKIAYLGIQPVQRPLFPEDHPVTCDDSLLERLDLAGLRTLACCQHDHFEDCPMREQGLYAYDSRNQALYGYPVWGNYKFVADSYLLLAQNWNEGADTIQMCSPGDIHLVIPIFGLVFVSAAWELYLHSGDPALVTPLLPAIDRILRAALRRIQSIPRRKLALALPPEHPDVWNFCEWQPGLDGRPEVAEKWEAPYTLYLVEALRAAARLSRHLRHPLEAGDPAQLESRADSLAKDWFAFFWNRDARLCRTCPREDAPLHEHIQFLALCNHAIPREHRHEFLRGLETAQKEGRLLPSTTSTLPYWLMGSLKLPKTWREKILPRLLQVFSPSLFQDSSTLWETELGGEDFTFAGSLCHGWSSLPSWYLRAVALGITPATPGYRTFHFNPELPPNLHYLSSKIATPYGPIHAECRRDSQGKVEKAILQCPPQIHPVRAPHTP
ncbi:MAG: family 78 glycoside hydrolase catalytic domain [Oligosphaeraceae bacterium]